MLVDQNGAPKAQLQIGEQKSLQTDRVILVPGPNEEVATVRRVYRLFVDEHRRESEIAQLLNGEGIRNAAGDPWTRGAVHQLLTNEKYLGHNVFNRTSFKLKKRRVKNPPEMWVRRECAFDPIVDAELFEQARRIVLDRHRRLSDGEMLAQLRLLLERHGQLSALLIDETEGMPSSAAYRHRFGTLVSAYGQIGYTPARDYSFIETNRALKEERRRVLDEVIGSLERAGASVTRDPDTDRLTINGEFTAEVVLSRCQQTLAGSLRWTVALNEADRPDLTVAVRMDSSNGAPLDYYLFPALDASASRMRLQEQNGLYVDAFRFDVLEFFYALAARAPVEVAA
jgi:hypothetical protein